MPLPDFAATLAPVFSAFLPVLVPTAVLITFLLALLPVFVPTAVLATLPSTDNLRILDVFRMSKNHTLDPVAENTIQDYDRAGTARTLNLFSTPRTPGTRLTAFSTANTSSRLGTLPCNVTTNLQELMLIRDEPPNLRRPR
jgi:hypothetical protein